MPDASFDVVVIGGGHQGLIAANYMIRNGMTVGLFEQRRELGGGGATESRPASGFLGNPCAHIAGLWASPVNQDFKLYEHGLNYIFPEVHGSMIFPDETCIVSYRAADWDKETGEVTPRLDNIEKNIKVCYDHYKDPAERRISPFWTNTRKRLGAWLGSSDFVSNK